MGIRKLAVFAILFCFIGVSVGFASDKESDENLKLKRKEAANKIKTMNPEKFKAMQKRTNMRKPQTISPQMIEKLNKKDIKKNNPSTLKKKEDTQLNDTKSLPNNMIFPGEFEEVKAIMMTWSYITLDSNGNPPGDNIYIEPLFENMGLYYDYSVADTSHKESDIIVSSGKIVSIPDTFDIMSEIPVIFAKLAHAIDQNAEVWINLWYPEDTITIKSYMAAKGMELKNAKFFINQGNSFWYRDCGPQAFYYSPEDSIGFIDFEYYGGRPLDDEIPIFVGKKMGYPVFTNSIEYEGGNIILDGQGSLFTSNRVYDLNADTFGQYIQDSTQPLGYYQATKPSLSSSKVRDSLTKYLNLKKCNVLTSLINDGGTGHMDLYADMWDETNFVFTQMPSVLKSWTDYKTSSKNIDTIMNLVKFDGSRYRKSYIPFPRKDDGSWYKNTDDYDTLTRSYSNHTFVNKAIIQPVFASNASGDMEQMNMDLETIRMMYPGYNVIPIDVRAFDGFGGAIHCITKQIPADNPLRIYHVPIAANSPKYTAYTIKANLQNKSGIKDGFCFWRYKGDDNWKTVQLIPGESNSYSGDITNSLDSGTIEYYLSATSNNGKTLTKPMTAPAGFYTFNFGQTTGIREEILSSGIGEFYPNPANDKATIRFNNGNRSFSVTIADIKGNIIYSNMVDNTAGFDAITINTGSFNSGAYIVTFDFSNGSVVQRKLIIVK